MRFGVSYRARAVFLAVTLSTAFAAGCSGRPASLPQTPAQREAPTSPSSVRPAIDSRCQVFSANFDVLTACQRADGTLRSFGNPRVAWRVRYFVRYWEMPCREAPTLEEGYVFHMVTNDLYDDSDLSDGQRITIRNALFDGPTHCG